VQNQSIKKNAHKAVQFLAGTSTVSAKMGPKENQNLHFCITKPLSLKSWSVENLYLKMRNKGDQGDGICSIMVSECGDRCLFIF
jgi:hypothetical protein